MEDVKNFPIKNDRIKDCIAMENGYNLLRIWEDEIEENYVSKCVL